MAAAGTGVIASYGSLSITTTKNAPYDLQGQSVSSSGFALGGGVGTVVELFSKVRGQIYFNQSFSGSSVESLFRSTNIIHTKSGGSLIKYSYIQGFDSKGNLLWYSHTKGTTLGWGFGSDRYPVNLK